MKRLFSLIEHDMATLRDRYPTIALLFKQGEAQEFPAERDHAYTLFRSNDEPLEIVLAPRLAMAHPSRIHGVLRHEFGHAALFHMGKIDHTEDEADEMAEAIYGTPIAYDEMTVQTIGPGSSRPPWLHGE